jgi:hypothetical protein
MGADNILQEERGGNSKIRFIYEAYKFFLIAHFLLCYLCTPTVHTLSARKDGINFVT